MCAQMWKDPLQRFMSLSVHFQNRNSVTTSTNFAWIAWEVIFVSFLPCSLIFPILVYLGLPASVIYGAPWTLFFSDYADASPSLTALTIVLWIVSLHGLDLLASSLMPKFENEKPHKVWQLVGRLGLLMAFFGALCMSSFTGELAQLDAQIQYVGPVRLSHIAMYAHDGSQSSTQETAADGVTKYPYVYASWTAEFGASWACPHMKNADNHWCQVRQKACHHTACYKAKCSESEIDFSMAMTRECLNMISLHWTDGAYDSTLSFDRHVSPREDGKHWPSMTAYANCETCEIYGSTRTGYAQAQELLRNLPYAKRLRGYGISLLISGWLLSGATFVWVLLFSTSRNAMDDFIVLENSGAGEFDLADGDLELEVVLQVSGGVK